MILSYEYLLLAAGTWFMGFFPLAEIYVAIPAGMATGLDDLSVIVWAVLGNFTPILLIHFGYQQLLRSERVRGWFNKLVTDKTKERVDRYGAPLVLILTPWVGVWGMALTAKTLQMNMVKFTVAAAISITVYAVLVVMLVNAGVSAVAG